MSETLVHNDVHMVKLNTRNDCIRINSCSYWWCVLMRYRWEWVPSEGVWRGRREGCSEIEGGEVELDAIQGTHHAIHPKIAREERGSTKMDDRWTGNVHNI